MPRKSKMKKMIWNNIGLLPSLLTLCLGQNLNHSVLQFSFIWINELWIYIPNVCRIFYHINIAPFTQCIPYYCNLKFQEYFFYFLKFIFNWRIITWQYCVGFFHTTTWISHKKTCPLPLEPLSHPSPHPTPLGYHWAPCWAPCIIQIIYKSYL